MALGVLPRDSTAVVQTGLKLIISRLQGEHIIIYTTDAQFSIITISQRNVRIPGAQLDLSCLHIYTSSYVLTYRVNIGRVNLNLEVYNIVQI